MVDYRLGGLHHPLHKFLVGNIPHVIGTGGSVDHSLADASVGAADADVLGRTAESAFGVSLKVGFKSRASGFLTIYKPFLSF